LGIAVVAMLKNLVFLKPAAEKKLAPLTFSTSRGHPAVSNAEKVPQSSRYTRSRVSGASTASAWISNTFVCLSLASNYPKMIVLTC